MIIVHISIIAALAPYAMPARTVPIAPTELMATAISPTRVDLTWKDNSDDEHVFVVERRPGGSSTWSVAWDELNANFPSFSDMGLSPGARYEYRVKARDKSGNESRPSNTAAATTPSGPPLYNNLLRDRLATASSFDWRKVPPYQAVDGTQWTRWVSRRTTENLARVDWLVVDMGSRQTIDKMRIIWQRNYWATKYEIHISDDAAEWRTVLSAERPDVRTIDDLRFPPVTGRYVRFYGTESGSKTARWGRYGGYSFYAIEAYAPGVDPDPLEWESVAFMKPATASAQPRTAASAVDSHMGTFWSTGSRLRGDEHSFTVDLGAEQDIYEIIGYWHVPAEYYRLRLSSDGVKWRTVADQGSVIVASIVNEELKEVHTKAFGTPEGARHVRVVVSGKAIHEDPKFTSIILQELVVKGAPHGAPQAPKDLRAKSTGPRRVSLEWKDTSTNETGFEVERRELGTSTWAVVAKFGANVKSCEDGPLPAGKSFVYRVRAVNERGASVSSNQVPVYFEGI